MDKQNVVYIYTLKHHSEKEEQKNPKASRRKEIIKIRSEINEKEKKERNQDGVVEGRALTPSC